MPNCSAITSGAWLGNMMPGGCKPDASLFPHYAHAKGLTNPLRNCWRAVCEDGNLGSLRLPRPKTYRRQSRGHVGSIIAQAMGYSTP